MIPELQNLNITSMEQVTKEMLLSSVSSTINGFLIVLFLVMSFSFLIFGMALVETGKARLKIFWIWLSSMVISLIVLVMMIMMPNTFSNWIDNILNIFGGK